MIDKNIFIDYLQTYEGISEIAKNCTYREIVQIVCEMMSITSEKLENLPMGGYSKGKNSGAYYYVLEDLLRNIEYYDWVYSRLSDDKSRRTFTSLIQFRILPDKEYIKAAYDESFPQYFDKEIVNCDDDEVFVDCGGFIGDTTEEFIRQFEKYKSIYVYEPSSDNLDQCRSNLEKYENIRVSAAGVGEKKDCMAMDTSSASSSFMNASEESENVEIISLDEDIKEKVTFIKMDVEGFEIPAILGAKNHIKNDIPKLAICTYHIISDLWEIPKLIDTIYPHYRFYLRHYMEDQNWETVLYAIPEEGKKLYSLQSCPNHKKRVVAMMPYERGWSNVEMIKDCGLIPYLLYKNHNCDSIMVGADGNGPYLYHEKYTQGVNLEFLPDGKTETKVHYLEKNAKNIDVLILRGCYSTNFPIATAYKLLNPTGKIYVGLDANSFWMDRIRWDDKLFVEFMEQCDVIATSCFAMQKYLNEKWPWKIEHIPNGYYDFDQNDYPIFEEKENIIITVGRLGTMQKATEVLLEAFAKIALKIPEWKLCLIGGEESEFGEYKESFFAKFPELKERIEFTGPIEVREELLERYRKAKIFALTSTLEGGTPNVISEALHSGCVVATTKIDAYEEATDFGKCGAYSEVGDIDGFAGILYTLCTNSNLGRLSEHAYCYSKVHFDMEKIVARVYELLFGGVL